jgi:hypothetical protein
VSIFWFRGVQGVGLEDHLDGRVPNLLDGFFLRQETGQQLH